MANDVVRRSNTIGKVHGAGAVPMLPRLEILLFLGY